MLRQRIFRLRGIFFRAKNSPAKNYPDEEFFGEVSSASGEIFFERRIFRRRIIRRRIFRQRMFREPFYIVGLQENFHKLSCEALFREPGESFWLFENGTEFLV
jgi:hypothetical protein